MRTKKHQLSDVRITLDLVKIARIYRRMLPYSEQAHYEAYMSHLGRNDFVAACKLAEERTSPIFWADSTAEVYRDVRQAYSLSEKVTLKGDKNAETAAWQKFLKMEKKCQMTNRKVRYLKLFPHRWSSVTRGNLSYFDVVKIQRLVSRLLGDFWLAYCEIVQHVGYGKGMSLSSRDVHRTSVPFKLSDMTTVTSDGLPVWRDFIKYGGVLPDWVEVDDIQVGKVWKVREKVQLVPGCKITFVDKTPVIKRTIAIEPSANVAMQLSVHRYIAKRLKWMTMIDLSDQTLNRNLALRGSRDGSLATIDLSSASDTISSEVARLLLPSSWYAFLDAIRSKRGTYRGSMIEFEKFSSMGNGFTFALETVLFYAISKVLCGGEATADIAVYGDDIIIPATAYSRVVGGLTSLGFLVNTKKSFSVGPFRESCGLDAFNGVDVRPVFVRSKELTITQATAFHNLCFTRGLFDVCEYVEKQIPSHYRLFGPSGPEGGFLFTKDPMKLKASRSYDEATQSYTYLGYTEVGKRIKFSQRLLLQSFLFHGGAYSSGAPLRSVTRTVTVAVHRDC